MRSIGFSPARRAIAQYVRAAGRINHVTLNMEVRADRLREFCAARDLTYTPVLMKVTTPPRPGSSAKSQT